MITRLPRLAAVLMVPLAAGALTACGELPQPFRHEGPGASLARPKLLVRGITIRPLGLENGADPAQVKDESGKDGPGKDGPGKDGPGKDGLGDPAIRIADAMVEAFGAQDIPATVNTAPTFGHVLTARLQPLADGPVLLSWVLRAPDGHEAASFVQSVPRSLWKRLEQPAKLDGLDKAAMKHLTNDAVTVLSMPLVDPDALAQPQLRDPSQASRPTVRIAPLAGLPGDGATSLDAALRRALDGAGLTVVRDGEADFQVSGQVVVVPNPSGEDMVTVTWTTRQGRGGGEELGSVSQDGSVPRGRLDQPWGVLARDIAEGGAQGVAQIVRAVRPKPKTGGLSVPQP